MQDLKTSFVSTKPFTCQVRTCLQQKTSYCYAFFVQSYLVITCKQTFFRQLFWQNKSKHLKLKTRKVMVVRHLIHCFVLHIMFDLVYVLQFWLSDFGIGWPWNVIIFLLCLLLKRGHQKKVWLFFLKHFETFTSILLVF